MYLEMGINPADWRDQSVCEPMSWFMVSLLESIVRRTQYYAQSTEPHFAREVWFSRLSVVLCTTYYAF
jgi:hypothetical protein